MYDYNLSDTTLSGMVRLERQLQAMFGHIDITVVSTEMPSGNSYCVFGLTPVEFQEMLRAFPLWEGRKLQ